jgi:hypothetical protein
MHIPVAKLSFRPDPKDRNFRTLDLRPGYSNRYIKVSWMEAKDAESKTLVEKTLGEI